MVQRRLHPVYCMVPVGCEKINTEAGYKTFTLEDFCPQLMMLSYH